MTAADVEAAVGKLSGGGPGRARVARSVQDCKFLTTDGGLVTLDVSGSENWAAAKSIAEADKDTTKVSGVAGTRPS